MELAILWLLFSITCLVIASGKGRSPIGWLFAGFILGPFALAMIACLPAKPAERAP